MTLPCDSATPAEWQTLGKGELWVAQASGIQGALPMQGRSECC